MWIRSGGVGWWDGVVGGEWIKSGIRRREDRDGKGNGRGME